MGGAAAGRRWSAWASKGSLVAERAGQELALPRLGLISGSVSLEQYRKYRQLFS